MTIYCTKLIIAAIIILAVMAALTMYSLMVYASKSRSDYERAMDDQEQIEYLRSVNRKKAATK
jgi:type II secretory pathway pseudopilin PulG